MTAANRARAGAAQRLIEAAMELERQSMQLYCKFYDRYRREPILRSFWFDMAQHESRHFGALALVAGLLAAAHRPALPPMPAAAHVARLRALLRKLHREVDRGVDTRRAFEMAIELEGSEIEDLVLDLLQALKGVAERERAVQLLIHDLGDLSYMIEKYTDDSELLARADALLEQQVKRLRSARTGPQR